MSKFIFIRPVFDDVTQITFDEAQDAIDYLRERGVEIIDLAKQNAIREKVEEAIREHLDAGIAHYDHGNPECVWGNDDRPVIDLKNVELLSGRVCYNNNCSSAKRLGVDAWKLKATFWGFKDVVYFTTDALEQFKQFFNNGIKRKADGYTWAECLRMTKELATKLIDELVKTGKALAASCLRHNRDILVCYDANPPDTECFFRRLALKIFEPVVGWKISRKEGLGIISFLVGWGVALHAVANELFHKGGVEEILKVQGEYIGLSLMMVGFVLLAWNYFKWLKR